MNANDLTRLIYLARAPIVSEWLDGLVAQVAQNVTERHNYYRLLYHLVRTLKPEVALEIGVEFGIASAHMALAASEYGGIVIGVDHHFHDIPGEQIPARYPNYHFVVGDSTEPSTIEQVVGILGDRYIGVVFQDSSHHYKESQDEWTLYSALLSSRFVWVCDDISPAFHDPKVDPPGCSMVTYFAELPGHKVLFPDVLHRGGTIGVVIQ